MILNYALPDLSGIKVARSLQLHLDNPPLVIFVTQDSHGAVDAFKVDAVDYILKPLEASHMKRAIERTRDRLLQRSLYQQTEHRAPYKIATDASSQTHDERVVSKTKSLSSL